MRATRLASAVILAASLLFVSASPAAALGGPSVTTHTPTGVTATGANLRAYVSPGLGDAWYRFQYGTTTGYGSLTQWRFLNGSLFTYLVTDSLSGLQPGTTYNYRVVGTDYFGNAVSYGANRLLTTVGEAVPAASPAPSAGQGQGPAAEPAPAGPDAPLPPPPAKLGTSVGLAPQAGKVTVKRPGAAKFVPLTDESVVPAGSVIDANRGSVTLTSQLPSGSTQSGRFGGGAFKVGQSSGGYVDLYLRGPVCAKPARKRSARKSGAVATTAARRKPSGRRLFGRDRGGRFRTHGRNSHATVRGTRWMVADTCAGTLTRVTEGAVVVKDFAKKKRVLVKAGGRYLARPRR